MTARRSRFRLLLGTLLTLAGLAPATAEELTLGQAMARARSAAREVAAARSRDAAAAARLAQARAHRLPAVRLQEIWMRTDSPADAFGLQLMQERFSFPAFVASDPNHPEAIENALTRLELTMPLYTGGELAGRIRQAGLAAEAAGERAAWIEEGAALAAAEAWIRLTQIRARVALLERSLETVAAHVEVARAYVEQGMLVRSELLRAEVELARIEDLLSEARGQARLAEANLSFRLAVDDPASWELPVLPDPEPLADELATWQAGADARRDLMAARRMLAAGELEEKVQRSGLKPKIGLVARYDWNDDAPFGTHGDSTAVMAVGSIDLFAGGRHRKAAAAARAEAEAGRREVEHFREGIRLEIRGAWERATSARERHRTAVAAQQAAAEAERITGERFEKGVAKTIDLLDAATARREAEARELVARAEALLSSLELAVAAGQQPESLLPAGLTTPPEPRHAASVGESNGRKTTP